MKIALISGSPKPSESASKSILNNLKKHLDNDEVVISEYSLTRDRIKTDQMKKMVKCDAIVFIFPLYVDGIPSHLLSCLIELEEFLINKNKKEITVYTIVNCGFYEGDQNNIAISIMENWSIKTGLKWGQGIGVGAGGMILSVKSVPGGYGPKKNLDKAMQKLSKNILELNQDDNIYITMNFPKIAYKFAAHFNWIKSARINGLKRKDLFLRK